MISRTSLTVISMPLPFSLVIDCKHVIARRKSPPEASTIFTKTGFSAFKSSSLHMYSNLSIIFSSPSGLNRNFVQREVRGSMIDPWHVVTD